MVVHPAKVRDCLGVLRRWAQFGKTYAPRRVAPLDWSPVGRLIDAAELHLLEQAHELRGLLTKSSDKFGMDDPLLNDLGTHRWIDKETSYSDWLAWVLERLEPSDVLELLDVTPPFNPQHSGKCQVQRESQLDKRYIDLLIRFDREPGYAIGVEIKTYDDEYPKQEHYLKSLRRLYDNDVPCILITIDDIREDDRYGFTPRLWRKMTFVLREKIAKYAEKNDGNQIIMALMLGFVAAVEQNLLGFSPAAPRRVLQNQATLIPERLAEYLRGDDK